ncbi:MAG: bifunctional diaminohydroxyphosphoribosylaminopyrimidine deaminase/5-amino-6-(5-phosphoribosylamino)uracil reductase RibD [Desulfobacterales bacterium]|nr:bifunctional diaminohydroxyphosphoribosylaminopyrimidine deaminase/5-amino-6-(5-phosphoribosylamino)uracil reductase RibD [Desulfobacterales bacterium]MCP4162317.1 bifunctional diaminohydroxyphosphoribosylaminopyrimidine deaminase/5-amino-6-(5-phosphoribosylamino)uracil reductase RibD [Deltaproteobacteria bacterium]
MSEYTKYMEMALSLAEKGEGAVSPNPMVGAVLVNNGKVVGSGYHEKCGGHHAEVNAINDAGDEAKNSTLYVTLEPCNHTGKTPPCTKKILDNGITKVIVAMKDPNPSVEGGGSEFLRKHGVEVIEGVLEEESKKLNEFFSKHILTKEPFVILKSGSTLDGKIATKTGDSKWITNSKSRKFVHEIRNRVDAICVGVGTVQSDNPSLTTRLDSECFDPVRVILDTNFSIPADSKLLYQKSNAGNIIVVGENLENDPRAIAKKKKLSGKSNTEVLYTPIKDGRIDIETLMVILGKNGITSILVEGGSHVATSFLEAKKVDKVCMFYAPKILLSEKAVPMLRGDGPNEMKDALTLTNVSVSRFDEDVMIEGYLK